MKTIGVSPKIAAVCLLAILLAAAGLRLHQLSRPALWEDDYLNLDRALMDVSRMALLQLRQGPADTPYDFQPPLSFALEHLALGISPTAEAARMVSVVSGVLAVLGTFALGRALFGAEAGLLGALLLTFSLFHLDYSRAIKAYGLFYCFSVWSAWAVHAAVRLGGAWRFARFWLLATAMAYSAYIGLPAFAGQAAWAGLAVAAGLLRREPGFGRRALGLGLACLGVGLCYLPWLPAVLFLQQMFSDPSVNPLARLSRTFVQELLNGYYLTVFAAPGWFAWALAGLTLAGAACALTAGRAWGLLLIVLWAGVPTLSVLLSKSIMNEIVSTRHLFNLLAPLTLLPGLGAWSLGRLAGRGPRLGLALGALAALGLLWPAVQTLPAFYARSISLDRDYFFWMDAKPVAADAAAFEGYKRKSKAFGLRWHMPGAYQSPGDMAGRGFYRLALSENLLGDTPPLALPHAEVIDDWRLGPFRTRTSLLGVVPRAPIAILPDASGRFAYAANFKTPAAYADLSASENAAPDMTLGHLAPVRASLPGRALYRFSVPQGLTLGRVEAVLTAALYKRHPDSPADAAIEVLAGPEPGALRPVAAITYKNFLDASARLPLGPCKGYEEQAMYASCARAALPLDLTGLAGRELCLEVRFRPGLSEGFMELSGLTLAASGSWADGAARPDPVRLELDTLVRNGPVLPWSPDAAPGQTGLFAFALAPGSPLAAAPVGDEAQLAAFKARHPGEEPVYTLADASGRDVVAFYAPRLSLTAARPALTVQSGLAANIQSLTLAGKLDVPSLMVGSTRLDMPVSFPRGSTLAVNLGGEGRLTWSPDFSKAKAAEMDFTFADNIRPTPDADNDGGLTCDAARPCAFTYDFVSGLPLSDIRLEWHPRVSAAPDKKNAATLSVSADGGPFTVVERYAGEGKPGWTAMFQKHARRLAFPKPVHHLTLKVELTGEDAQAWSHSRPVDRMWLWAKVDARSVKPLAVPDGPVSVRLAEPRANDFTVRIGAAPRPFYDGLKDWR